jgi:hypothetical protein
VDENYHDKRLNEKLKRQDKILKTANQEIKENEDESE